MYEKECLQSIVAAPSAKLYPEQDLAMKVKYQIVVKPYPE